MKKIVFGLMVSTVAMSVSAQNIPSSFAKDPRIKQVRFDENNVVPIEGKTFTTTQIQFGTKEKVLDVEGGDTTAWMVTVHPELPNMMFIKPTMLHSDTNMTVITNQHTYFFHLSSHQNLSNSTPQQTYALKFNYPSSPTREVHKIKKIPAPKVVSASYRFSGSPQLVPLHVFDDGRFTYFEWGPNAPVPAIFAVDDKSGREAIVNMRQQGKYWVVQRMAPQFTLRHGGLVTSVFNAHEITRINANGRPQ